MIRFFGMYCACVVFSNYLLVVTWYRERERRMERERVENERENGEREWRMREREWRMERENGE